MTKPELVKKVAAVVGISQAKAEEAVNATMGFIAEAVEMTGRFEFAGFGVFKKVKRAACQKFNPQNPAQKVLVPAHNTVKFKPAPALKARVN
jgi:DNA-binding protein HU-beta